MTVWYYDSGTIWQCDSETVWHYDSVTVWHYDGVTLCQCDIMSVRHYDSVTFWQCGIMTVWYYERVILWQCDRLTVLKSLCWSNDCVDLSVWLWTNNLLINLELQTVSLHAKNEISTFLGFPVIAGSIHKDIIKKNK